jgi:hypothetical protein
MRWFLCSVARPLTNLAPPPCQAEHIAPTPRHSGLLQELRLRRRREVDDRSDRAARASFGLAPPGRRRLNADWFQRRDRRHGLHRGRLRTRSASAGSGHRNEPAPGSLNPLPLPPLRAPRKSRSGAPFSCPQLVIGEEPAPPAYSRAEPSSAVPRHRRSAPRSKG